MVKQRLNVSRVVRVRGGKGMLRGTAFLVVLMALLLAVALPVSADGEDTFPSVFNVPTGRPPEGIATGRGSSFYVSSLLYGGVYGGDLRTGEGATVVPDQPGRMAVGLAVDVRSNAIFVAGGGPLLAEVPGSGYVYDAETGAELAVYPFDGVFVNDVVVTREAAYFTDSGRPVLYKVPLGPRGRLPDPSAVQEIELDGFDFDPTELVNANGIDATPDGKTLILANTGLASVYKVDAMTGKTTKIDLGGDSLPFVDGLVLAGRTLYAVQNQAENTFSEVGKIGVVTLDPSMTSGVVSDAPLESPDYDVPVTAARFGRTIYAVNARFDDWFYIGVPPDGLEFTVVGIPMR
jgi:sugar lactone lactonase YvrE